MKNEKSFSYEKFRSSFSLNCPDDFNFAFDIISNKYGKSEKTALIAINKNGNDFEKISYRDLDENSSICVWIGTWASCSSCKLMIYPHRF